MLWFVGAGSKQSMENWCMRRCDCNLSLLNFILIKIQYVLVFLYILIKIQYVLVFIYILIKILVILPNFPRFLPILSH